MTSYRIEPLAECHREMFGDLVLTCPTPLQDVLPKQIIQPIPYRIGLRRASVDSILPVVKKQSAEMEKRRASDLVEKLLMDIYNSVHTTTDYNSTSGKSHKSSWSEVVNLQEKDVEELISILSCLKNYVDRMGSVLVRQLKRRDALRRQQEAYCDVITKQLAKRVPQGDSSEDMRFSIHPLTGDTGFSQWVTAMKMVAQLPGGIPPEFRRKLWLQLADRHLTAKGVDWPKVERTCFSEWSHPADAELGIQIVKDLHRTGCSLFCGEDGQENQVLLKRVLLAYARWNKAVGYCQGFNMLAALILQVTEKSENDALKLMIYLIEGVLPDSYFADSLRGLSVDMAVFRELLRSRFPRLSKHLDVLQNAAKDGSRSYEPPLTNVFTMQWFLTLFCNCLPQPTVLRVWDLILLEGNEILLRTALAIWQVLGERILSVRSADEFYCMMGVLTRELLEFELVDGNALIKAVVALGPLTELNTLREHYMYNITPWGTAYPQSADKQLKLYPKQSIALDISGLKKQYVKLKHRQRQAHIIFTAAISRQPSPAPPVTMNHLLIGKSALIPAKRLGPPKGTIPPARQVIPSTLHWKDAPKQTSSSSSSDTELCDEESDSSSEEDTDKPSQFDNLPHDDTSLMKNDNTSASLEVVTPATENFETEDNLIVFKSESDEDSFEFEQFLSDRLKVTDQEAEDKVNFARRNSERALQIIQENSLILHRILQCQSRLSPSPPLLHTMETILDSDEMPNVPVTCNVIENIGEFEAIIPFEGTKAPQINIENDTSIQINKELISPEYGSKYTSILEKSRSLDEKYNALILNNPVSKTLEDQSDNKTCALVDLNTESKLFDKDVFTLSKDFNNDQVPSNINEPDSSSKLPFWKEDLDCLKHFELNKDICDTCPNNNPVETICIAESNETKDVENIYLSSTYTSYGALEESPTVEIDKYKTIRETYEFNYKELKENSNLNDLSKYATSPVITDDEKLKIKLEKEEENYTNYLFEYRNQIFSPKVESNLINVESKEDECKIFDFRNSGITVTNSSDESVAKYSLSTSSYKINSIVDNREQFLIEEPSKSLDISKNNAGLASTSATTCYSFLTSDKNSMMDIAAEPLEDRGSDACDIQPITRPFSLDVMSRTSSNLKSLSPTKSPVRSPVKSPYRSSISPNKTFNPFPVPLSSRQNKEVPLKLGLYRK